MKKLKNFLILHLFCLLTVSLVNGQSPLPNDKNTWQSIIGEVSFLDETAGKITIITADKKEISFEIDKKALFLRIRPNEKDLENAEKILFSEITKGSKILARGLYKSDGVFAAQIIVLVSGTGSGIENGSNENIEGIVTAIDPAKKQIKANINFQGGIKEISLDVSSAQTGFYRYSNNSLKFNNSVASSIDKIKPGDQLKAVGKLSDGLTFQPQTIVFGTFRTIGGKVVAVNAPKRELSIEDFQTKKIINIIISQENLSRMLDSAKAEELIDKYFKSAAASRERKDLRTLFDTLPSVSSEQIINGDSIIVSGTVSDDSSITAFYILKDVKPIFSYLEKLQKKGKPLPNLGGLNL